MLVLCAVRVEACHETVERRQVNISNALLVGSALNISKEMCGTYRLTPEATLGSTNVLVDRPNTMGSTKF